MEINVVEPKTKLVKPNLSNFIKSLRDVGYTFEIAVADIIDNSISANATKISIYTVAEPELIFSMLDNGTGMSDEQLIESMRLATNDPDLVRNINDLGRFGLGLKTASFSQCKKLTVISKKDGIISAKLWDLDYISSHNEWLLITPEVDSLEHLPLVQELQSLNEGTVVVWQNIDRYKNSNFIDEIDKLRKHLSLVFHRFLEGGEGLKKIRIYINNNEIKPFNPFNINSSFTQCGTSPEKLKLFDSIVTIQPYILPHPANLSQQEYDYYATDEGYTKSQGFYLYRANRLLIHGTWWGLHKTIDAHKLVRIKIDISNNQDKLWGIDIKKSTAKPAAEIKKDLVRVINNITVQGSKPFTGRGRKIEDKSIIAFWEILPVTNGFRFALNKNHPIYERLMSTINEKELLTTYLQGIQAYLPLEAIEVKLQHNHKEIKQETALSEDDKVQIAERLKFAGLNDNEIEKLLQTEIFKNRKDLFNNE